MSNTVPKKDYETLQKLYFEQETENKELRDTIDDLRMENAHLEGKCIHYESEIDHLVTDRDRNYISKEEHEELLAETEMGYKELKEAFKEGLVAIMELEKLGYVNEKGEVDFDKLLSAKDAERLKHFDKKWC